MGASPFVPLSASRRVARPAPDDGADAVAVPTRRDRLGLPRSADAAAIRPKDPGQTQGELCRRVPADRRRRVHLGEDERDALALHPYLSKVPVRVAHLGADHVDSWPSPVKTDTYAVAFGHFSNKNVDLVLTAWSALQERQEGATCRCAWSESPRPTIRVCCDA